MHSLCQIQDCFMHFQWDFFTFDACITILGNLAPFIRIIMLIG